MSTNYESLSGSRVVFIYIGERLPRYGISALNLANKYSGLPVTLIADSQVSKQLRGVKLDFVAIDSFYSNALFEESSSVISSNPFFRNGFWLRTLERFFVLEQYVQFRGLNSFFHAELDQLLFRVDLLIRNLDQLQVKGIFLPFHSKQSAIASIVYCNYVPSLTSFINYVERSAKRNAQFSNEMEIMATWAKENNDKVFALPTLASTLLDNNEIFPKNLSSVNYIACDGMADAAQIGQWIAGVDVRNLTLQQKPYTKFVDQPKAGLLNESLLQDLRLDFDAELGILSFQHKKSLQSKFYNLHIHSKIHKLLDGGNWRMKLLFKISNSASPRVLPGQLLKRNLFWFSRRFALSRRLQAFFRLLKIRSIHNRY